MPTTRRKRSSGKENANKNSNKMKEVKKNQVVAASPVAAKGKEKEVVNLEDGHQEEQEEVKDDDESSVSGQVNELFGSDYSGSDNEESFEEDDDTPAPNISQSSKKRKVGVLAVRRHKGTPPSARKVKRRSSIGVKTPDEINVETKPAVTTAYSRSAATCKAINVFDYAPGQYKAELKVSIVYIIVYYIN